MTDMDADVLAARIQSYFQAKVSDDELAEKFGIGTTKDSPLRDSDETHVSPGRTSGVSSTGHSMNGTSTTPRSSSSGRKEIMQHQGHTQSPGMATTRFTKGETPCHFFATRLMVEKISL